MSSYYCAPGDFICTNFIAPLWDHAGYNPVNTLTYALIALVVAYAIYASFKRLGIKVDRDFVISILPFIALGSTVRVVTDTIDTGVMQAAALANSGNPLGALYSAILVSHLFDYGYLTVTPGIYVVTGLLAIAAVLLFHVLLKRPALLPAFGLLLWIPNLLLLLPLLRYPQFAALILLLAGIGTALSFAIAARYWGLKDRLLGLIIAAHALDGASTYVIVGLFPTLAGGSYFEQHVLSRAIGELFGTAFPVSYLPYLIVKLAFSTAAAVVLEKEEEGQARNFILLLLVIFGLAPGIRDVLRIAVGA